MTRIGVRLALSGCLFLAGCGQSSAKVDASQDAAPIIADARPPQDKNKADLPLDVPFIADVLLDAAPPDAPTIKTDTPPSDGPGAADAVSGDLAAGDTQSTRDAADSPKPITFAKWPGGNAAVNASAKNDFGPNLSGLIYQPAAGTTPAILWAVRNEPSTVFRLVWNGTAFVSATSEGWGNGKALTFPNGSGSPDSEALTRTEWDKNELYLATEKNNDAISTVRLSILRYELSGTGTKLKATHEWNLTSDLPKATDANKGLEAIAWIPDSYLVARGFYDEARKATYDPSAYADHGTGIFLVGVEDTGMVYGFALNHSTGAFKRVATFSSGQPGVMDMAFDRETETLWSVCDSACDDRMTLLDIDTTEGAASKGRFILRATVPPPTTLTSTNNEGITMASESECANGRKSFYWADDDESNGYAIRRDSIPCGRLF